MPEVTFSSSPSFISPLDLGLPGFFEKQSAEVADWRALSWCFLSVGVVVSFQEEKLAHNFWLNLSVVTHLWSRQVFFRGRYFFPVLSTSFPGCSAPNQGNEALSSPSPMISSPVEKETQESAWENWERNIKCGGVSIVMSFPRWDEDLAGSLLWSHGFWFEKALGAFQGEDLSAVFTMRNSWGFWKGILRKCGLSKREFPQNFSLPCQFTLRLPQIIRMTTWVLIPACGSSIFCSVSGQGLCLSPFPSGVCSETLGFQWVHEDLFKVQIFLL